jgi:hypothetical protein
MEPLRIINTIRGIIPGRRWIFYAALRLGAFLMIYFSLIGLAAIFLKGPTIMAFIGLVPVMVFIAIRLSGGTTEKWRPKGDYKSE